MAKNNNQSTRDADRSWETLRETQIRLEQKLEHMTNDFKAFTSEIRHELLIIRNGNVMNWTTTSVVLAPTPITGDIHTMNRDCP